MTQIRLGPLALLSVALAAVLLPGLSAANSSAFLLVDNEINGGPIETPLVTPDNDPNAMIAIGFHHLVRREYDPSGGGGGSNDYTPPQHRPLVVTVPLGVSTPQLFEAFSRGHRLTVTLRLYWQGARAFDLTLENAYLVAIEPVTLENNAELIEYQKLRFIYQRLTVHEEGASPDVMWQLQSWPF